MAGHSKWANIKHRKAAQDAKRGKIFTKLIRELVVAARTGGAEPADNPRLRAAIDKALGANMKKDTVEKAIERGAGNADGDNYEENTYEGYGTGGIAVIVETMTDNKNRTVAEVRHAFSKHGGSLGTEGSVAFQFSKIGQFVFEPGLDEDEVMEAALEAGADEVLTSDDGSIEVQCPWEDFMAVKDQLIEAGFNPVNAEVTMVAQNLIELDKDGAESVLKLIERLEDLDDVQNVYHNADISEEIMEQLDA